MIKMDMMFKAKTVQFNNSRDLTLRGVVCETV